jgi:hypothetical protein
LPRVQRAGEDDVHKAIEQLYSATAATDRLYGTKVAKRVKFYDRKCRRLYVSITPSGVATFSGNFTNAAGRPTSSKVGTFHPETFKVADARREKCREKWGQSGFLEGGRPIRRCRLGSQIHPNSTPTLILQVRHLGIAQDVPNAEHRHIRLVGQPVTLSRTPSRMAVRPPEFGEQTGEVLAEFGFGAEEIASLREAKVV